MDSFFANDGVPSGSPATRPERRRARSSRFIVALLGALALGVAAGPAFSQEAPVVAMAAALMPEVDDPAPITAAVERAISDALRGSGLVVLPSSEFERAWLARVNEVGGYFDVVSGRPDLAKRRALRAAALGDLGQGARVVLQPALIVVTAKFAGGMATWDGARESAAPSGSGEVPALSLALRVEDRSGREVATSRAGIQLLGKYSKWSGKYGLVPREKLLADEERLSKAVGLALPPVLEALRAAPVESPVVEPAPPPVTVEAPAIEIGMPPEGARVAALGALQLPDGEIVVPPDVVERYVAHLTSKLTEMGWWVLPPAAYEGTLRGLVLDRGGLYDPISGRGDDDKRLALVEETRRLLAERYGARVFVAYGIAQRSASFHGEKATWDGATEKVAELARWKKLLTNTRGTTHALSFGILVVDVDGKTQHDGWGGIQLADRIEHNRFVPVPADLLFVDPARDRNAIDLALAGWADAPAAAAEGR